MAVLWLRLKVSGLVEALTSEEEEDDEGGPVVPCGTSFDLAPEELLTVVEVAENKLFSSLGGGVAEAEGGCTGVVFTPLLNGTNRNIQ